MKYKKGYIIIYCNHGDEWFQPAKLEIGKKCIVNSVSNLGNDLYVSDSMYWYDESRFMTLEQYRKLKLLKIKNKIKNYEI